jgi:hypothetical protein
MSHVLRDVSDQLALAELQNEPVMAGAPPEHERFDAERISTESILATPEEITNQLRADMVAA